MKKFIVFGVLLLSIGSAQGMFIFDVMQIADPKKRQAVDRKFNSLKTQLATIKRDEANFQGRISIIKRQITGLRSENKLSYDECLKLNPTEAKRIKDSLVNETNRYNKNSDAFRAKHALRNAPHEKYAMEKKAEIERSKFTTQVFGKVTFLTPATLILVKIIDAKLKKIYIAIYQAQARFRYTEGRFKLVSRNLAFLQKADVAYKQCCKQKKEVKQDVQTTDCSLYQSKIIELQKQIERLSTRIWSLHNQLANVEKTDCSLQDKEIANLKNKIAELNKQIAELQNQLANIEKTDCSLQDKEIADLQNKIAELNKQIAELQNQLANVEKTDCSLQDKEIADLKNKIEELKKQLADTAKVSCTDQDNKIIELQKQIEELKKQLADTEKVSCTEQNKEIADLKNKISELEKRIEELMRTRGKTISRLSRPGRPSRHTR